MIGLIEENPQESRREWLLNAFGKAGAANFNNSKNHSDSYRDRQQRNHPVEPWRLPVIQQKIDDAHENR